MSKINGNIEAILKKYESLTSEEKDTLFYILNKDFDMQKHLNIENVQKRWLFIGKNHKNKEIINRIFYAYNKEGVIKCVKKLNYLFRKEEQLREIARGDDLNLTEEQITHIINRNYYNTIVKYTIKEWDPNNKS